MASPQGIEEYVATCVSSLNSEGRKQVKPLKSQSHAPSTCGPSSLGINPTRCAGSIWKYIDPEGAEKLPTEAPPGPDLPTPTDGKTELTQYEMWRYTLQQAEHKKEYKEWDEWDKAIRTLNVFIVSTVDINTMPTPANQNVFETFSQR
jgi:hypothetical protein